MAYLPLIIGGVVLAALLVAAALIADIFRQRNDAVQGAASDAARLAQKERELRAQIAALEEQLAARNADFEKQAAELAEAAAQNARSSETAAALEQLLAQEKQAAADYRHTFDAQLANSDRLHASLAQTVSEMTGLWQKLRAAATGEALQSEAVDEPSAPGAIAPEPALAEPPLPEEEPAPDADVLDLESEAIVEPVAAPDIVEDAETLPALS